MSIASILGLSGTAHGAFATRSATSTASEEMQSLFSKLHLDAIASVSTGSTSSSGTTSSSGSTASTDTSSASSTSAVTGLMHGLRHIFDGGLTVAKEARSAAKAATAYASGGGIGAVATQVLDKLA